MNKLRYIFFTTIAMNCLVAVSQGIVVNEISQGPSGTKEYVEFVVVGSRTCTDTCLDLRKWVIDDNNGWLGIGSGTGIDQGSMRFADNTNWSCVPYGSVIVVYNNADKNALIPADDPTDSNNDHVYILPGNSTYLESNTTAPLVNNIDPNFSYPTTGFSVGGNWSVLALDNGNDGFIISSPSNYASAYSSLGWGSDDIYAMVNLGVAATGQTVFFLNDSDYSNTIGYTTTRGNISNVPDPETPGLANSTANATWIANLLTSPSCSFSITYQPCSSGSTGAAPVDGGLYPYGTSIPIAQYSPLVADSGCYITGWKDQNGMPYGQLNTFIITQNTTFTAQCNCVTPCNEH